MCGLVGVINKRQMGFTKEQQDIFEHLLFVDVLRGKDSTGVFSIENDGTVYVAKDTGPSFDFIKKSEYKEAQSRAWRRGSALIGHNRAATRGAVSDKNAHPFNVDDNIILVHNGTMRSDHKKHADVEVDSHAIAHLLQKKESVKEVLEAFHGAYALIWYNMENGELNMVRNDERPLLWAETNDAYIWSSEYCMIEFAVGRVGAKLKEAPKMLPVDCHQKFTLENRGWTVSSEQLEIKKYFPVQHAAVGADEYDDYSNWPYGGASSTREWEGTGGGNKHAGYWNQWRQREEAAAEQRRRTVFGGGPNQTVVELLPGPKAQQQQPTRTAGLSEREPAEFTNCVELERELLKSLNKRVSHHHYTDLVISTYPYNTQVHAEGFSYRYVNGHSEKDGYYLYLSPFDDSDVVIRSFMSAKHVTEERMIQLAGCGYIFECTVGTKSWHPMDAGIATPRGGVVDKDTEGFTIIRASAMKMIASPDKGATKDKVAH